MKSRATTSGSGARLLFNVLRYVDTSQYQAVWLQEHYMTAIITNCRDFICSTIKPLEVRFRHMRKDL